ncbi:hypothetical protein CHUAL_001590 [Chamberlinius hualienensis]
MGDDVFKYILSMVFASSLIEIAQSYQSCNSTYNCPKEYFCDLNNNKNKSIELGCVKCVNCSGYNRQSVIDCATTTDECGTCLNGYEQTKMNLAYCEITDVGYLQFTNEQPSITPAAAVTSVTSNEYFLVYVLWLPLSAIVVVAVTLFLSIIYKRRIRLVATKNNKYFDHVNNGMV